MFRIPFSFFALILSSIPVTHPPVYLFQSPCALLAPFHSFDAFICLFSPTALLSSRLLRCQCHFVCRVHTKGYACTHSQYPSIHTSWFMSIFLFFASRSGHIQNSVTRMEDGKAQWRKHVIYFGLFFFPFLLIIEQNMNSMSLPTPTAMYSNPGLLVNDFMSGMNRDRLEKVVKRVGLGII